MSSSIDERQIRQLYESHAFMVHARCQRFLGSSDEAWDATQEVFIRLMKQLRTIQKQHAVYSWLMSTSTNYCISVLRKKQADTFDEAAHGFSREDSPEVLLEHKLLLVRLLQPWKEQVRLVIIYTYLDGYTQEEIAELTGLGYSTIRKYLTRFRRYSKKNFPELQELLYA